MHPQKCFLCRYAGGETHFMKRPAPQLWTALGRRYKSLTRLGQVNLRNWSSQEEPRRIPSCTCWGTSSEWAPLLTTIGKRGSRGGDVTAYQGDLCTDPRWCREGPGSFVKTDPFIRDREGDGWAVSQCPQAGDDLRWARFRSIHDRSETSWHLCPAGWSSPALPELSLWRLLRAGAN